MLDSTFWFKGLELILSLSILVFVHELGHFMWARLFKVGVEKFYLFFDAYNFAIVRWNKEGLHICEFVHFPTLVNPSDTEYGIGWIPLGGYCAIVGMIDETHDAESADTDRADAFVKQAKYKQLLIMAGGVINNLILAVLIYIGMAWYWGKDIIEPKNLPFGITYNELAHGVGFEDGDLPLSINGKEVKNMSEMYSDLLLGDEVTVLRDGKEVNIVLPDTLGTHFLTFKEDLLSFAQPRYSFVVDSVPPTGGAFSAGIQVGDSIVMCDSVPTPYFHQTVAYLSQHALDTVMVSFYRADSLMTAAVAISEEGTMGVVAFFKQLPLTHIEYSLMESIPEGLNQGWNKLYDYVRQFKLVFTKEGAKELGGFGSMGAIFPENWIWKAFWSLTAFISVALAFMNILPIPALDGGHIMILVIEAIIRRPLSDRFKEILQYIGFGFIILLMVAVNANDLIKYFFN